MSAMWRSVGLLPLQNPVRSQVRTLKAGVRGVYNAVGNGSRVPLRAFLWRLSAAFQRPQNVSPSPRNLINRCALLTN
jgi:hypothetical protein